MRAALGRPAEHLRLVLPPLGPEDARIEVCGHGRLVRVGRGETAAETVVIRGAKLTAGISLFFARVGGAWRIAR